MTAGTWPNPVDHAVLDGVLAIRTPALTAVVRAITTVGNTLPMLAIGIAVVLVLAARGHRGWAAYCGLTSVASWVIMVALKDLFGRQRPPVPPRLVDLDSLSFPSGHAMLSAVVFGTAAVAAAGLTGRRWPLAAPLVGSLLIGLSRVYLAAHWMTDVLAGWGIGAVLIVAGAALRSALAARRDRRAAPPAAAG